MKKSAKKKVVKAAVEKVKEPPYTVKGQKVTWKYRNGIISISLDDLDHIFYQYSKHGLNMTQVQVQNHHGFDALQWQSFKRTFQLVKDSDVFSPYTLSLHTGKEQCDMIAKKIAEKYSPKNMRAVVAYEHQKQRGKAYEQAIKKAADLDYRRQRLETEILDYVTEAKVAPLVKKTKDVLDDHAIVHVCDLHIGAEIEAERNLPAYNDKVAAKYLKGVADETNRRKPKKVTLVINGDLIETFTGLNHINSWKNIDKRYGYGVRAIIKSCELLTEFISQVANVHEVILIAGNHDRVTSNNKEDIVGEVVMWAHSILEARFGKQFPVRWSKDVVSMKMKGCGFVFSHGHHGISKKNPDHIVNQYGYPGMFNLIVLAHLHTRKVLSDNLNNRTIHASSIFTGNNYSKNLGYSSLPGFLYVTVHKKYPVVVDFPLT